MLGAVRNIQIDQVNTFDRQFLHYRQAIAVVEPVHTDTVSRMKSENGSAFLADIVFVATLNDVGGGVLLAVMVVLSIESALYQCPEPFNCVRMNLPVCIANFVVDREVWNPLIHFRITGILIRYK